MAGSALIMFSPANAQNQKSNIYRIHIQDPEKIRNLEKLGLSILEIREGGWVDAEALPGVVDKLERTGIRTEYLAKDFKDLYRGLLRTKSNFFHTYAGTNSELVQLAEAYPALTRLDTIGYSVTGRLILCLKISDNPEIDEDEPPLLIVGNHHGNEIHSIEAVFYQINYLLSKYGTEEEVTQWVNSMEFWFVPLVNPDGRESMVRTNTNNVDLNRNYSFGFTAEYNHGPSAFSEPETRAIRDLAAMFPPIMSLTYHTSGQYFLYPWTHTDAAAPDSAAMVYLGNLLSEAVTYQNAGRTEHYTLRQGGRWYFTAGEYCDYMYVTHNTLAYTVEMGVSQAPDYSVVPAMVESNLQGFKTMLRQVNKAGVTGIITDAITGHPVRAEIEVTSIDGQGKLLPRLADSLYGRYYRYLAPGTYPFRFSAPGYLPLTIQLTVNADSLTHFDVPLMPEETLRISEIRLTDGNGAHTQGNSDGRINLGETLGLSLTLANARKEDAVNPLTTLTSDSPYLQLLTSRLTFGNIQQGTVKASRDTALFRINPDCPDGQEIYIQLRTTDDTGFDWTENYIFEVYAPVTEIDQIRLDDSGGNGNGTADSGETVTVMVTVRNSGRQDLHDIMATLTTDGNNFTVVEGESEIAEAATGATETFLFTVRLETGSPAGTIQLFETVLTSREGYSSTLLFRLHNIRGFFDDFELGENGWKHDSYGITTNVQDDWQLGQPAGLAGDPFSAYSGVMCRGNDLGTDSIGREPADGMYGSYVYNYITSPAVDCRGMKDVGLIYRRWLTTKLNDIGRILVNDQPVWESPDPGITDTTWVEHVIDISDIADGNPAVRVTFELLSNRAGQAGGWNIDDVMIGHGLASGLSSSGPQTLYTGKFGISVYPSPFVAETTIKVESTRGGEASVEILDLSGRKIAQIYRGKVPAGIVTFTWAGTSYSGTHVQPGIYLCRVRIGSETAVRLVSRAD